MKNSIFAECRDTISLAVYYTLEMSNVIGTLGKKSLFLQVSASK